MPLLLGIPFIYRFVGALSLAIALLVGVGYYGFHMGTRSQDTLLTKQLVELTSQRDGLQEKVDQMIVANKADADRQQSENDQHQVEVDDLNSRLRQALANKPPKPKPSEVILLEAPKQYTLSNGWVYLHDQAAQNLQADTGKSGDATPSGVSDRDALSVILGNYNTCTDKDSQILQLKDYISKVRKAFDDFNQRRIKQEQEAQKK